ncbi:MAG TPA: hypothetical protein VGD80_08890 [Kofleriaceae bacterium]
MQVLTLVVVVLAASSVLHLFLTFGLIARFRAFQDSTAIVPRDPDLPARGDVVQPFEATSSTGAPLSAATFASGAKLVGYFMPHCRPCDQARTRLLDDPPALPMIAFIHGNTEDAACQELGESLGKIAQVAYTARNESIMRAFRQAGFPMFIRVENGTVAASSHKLSDVLA